jgi:hypothetical protein
VAIGLQAGETSQGVGGVAIGEQAGHTSQGVLSVAIGYYAGANAQSFSAVAIGAQAGEIAQGQHAVAIGDLAGQTAQSNNSIILNATGVALNQTIANTFTVAPIRNDVANVAQVMFYNTTSKEVTYGNVISVAGNISGNYIFGNGSQLTAVNAATVDVTDTNGLTAVYYPTFVENRTTGQIARADVDLSYRTDNNTITVGNISTGTIVASGNITGGNISATGTVTATGKIGYASGSTVTQTTNRGNGVNINALAGTIITVSDSMTAGEIEVFSVTNNQVDTANDIVLLQVVSPNLGNYNVIANPNSGIGGFYVTLQNISGFAISAEAVTIRFMVIKAPNV